jgi:hypothetical protein
MSDVASHIIAETVAAFPAKQERAFVSLVNSDLGDEPAETAEAFRDKLDWRALDPAWLDQAANGWGTALSFLSDEAICFFIPAYLVADLNGSLARVEPLFHLTHGFTQSSRDQPIWSDRPKTWTEYATNRWARLSKAQAGAIVRFLEWHVSEGPPGFNCDASEALSTFWYGRAS